MKPTSPLVLALILFATMLSCDDDDEAKDSSFAEGFDDVASLIYRGWAMKDNGAPPGVFWKQGKSVSYISAQSGDENSFITSTFAPQTLEPSSSSAWLITPVIS